MAAALVPSLRTAGSTGLQLSRVRRPLTLERHECALMGTGLSCTNRPAALQWYRAFQSLFDRESTIIETKQFATSNCSASKVKSQACSCKESHTANQSTRERRAIIRPGRSLQALVSGLCGAALLMGSPSIADAAFIRPERSGPIIDGASIIPDAREGELAKGLAEFADQTGWKIRVITREGPGSFPSGNEVRSVWNLDDKTIVVIDDVSSPNVLNFNTGDSVRTKLPRQFFTELQSRFGNQFYIAEEGNAKALSETVGALRECLSRKEGCRFVPGLVDDLYFLTLACSIAAGAVFGFSARVPLSGRVNNQLTWILVFSPLWAFLLVSFGVLPITSRTSELEPLLKNGAAFLAGAIAVYLTPILGTPELPFSGGTSDGDKDED